MYKIYTKKLAIPKWYIPKIWLIMRLTVVILMASLMQVSASGFAQHLTLSRKQISLEKIFHEIHNQTGYEFLYNRSLIKKKKNVDINVANEPIESVLKKLTEDQQLQFSIEDKFIVIKERSLLNKLIARFLEIEVRGKVLTENGEALAGATVAIKGSGRSVKTNEKGDFYLQNVAEKDKLLISYIGYETLELNVKADMGSLTMKIADSKLDEITINAGYYTVKDKERTGSISKITSKEISQQPVANPLAAMQGRMAGVHITQSSGTPGGGFDIQIRGRNSLRTEGNAPLYMVDGVPLNSQSTSDFGISGGVMPLGNVSPLNSINPNDIESIEVLKDADATAIYGSRGSNGVVLITTKKGSSDKTTLSVQSTTSVSTVSKFMDLMDTQQYLQMRRDAYANDGVTEYPANAYDLNGTWDKNRHTDWQKKFIGGKAVSQNTQFSVGGGSAQTSYMLSASTRKDGTVFPGDFGYKRTNFLLNVNHRSKNEKFSMQANVQKSDQKNNLMASDITPQIFLSPNAPSLYDENGNLNWENNTFDNPLAKLNGKFLQTTGTYNLQTVIGYSIAKNIKAAVNMGYNTASGEEIFTNPSTMNNPFYKIGSESSFMLRTTSKRENWIIEPQLSAERKWDNHKMEILIGSTFEKRFQSALSIQASNFTSDDFIFNAANAVTQRITKDSETGYAYMAFFGRINYIAYERYIVNITGRRDGSSRFGPNNRFANFGALGGAWLFSREKLLENISWLSFGKLRASYGIAGSDLIGDYQYLNTFGVGRTNYDGNVGLEPLRLFNPDFSWETNKKLEAALELELFNGRLAPSISWYRNRSSNQLVGIPLPGTTGFSSVQANLNATVENSGWEFTLRTKNIDKDNFQWNTSINFSTPRNRLISFPNLEGSTYANQYVIGQPVTIKKVYRYLGVNREIGLFEFEDVNRDGVMNASDRQTTVNIGARLFGGLQNSFRYKNWTVDFLWQFVKQNAYTPDYGVNYLGSTSNRPVYQADYFTEGTQGSFQVPTAGANRPALQQYQYYKDSDAVIADASFIRLKSAMVQYGFSMSRTNPLRASLFFQGQNLLTLTAYKGLDPEGTVGFLPNLRTLAFGFQLAF
ncbi:MAG: SusC/RagA family TonB-linked outer membrane protein [Pedobacter sp.]|uniref:SusC/RagA family TonB-linked outer membrane protein n=1 Tax=Pedobacter sp. TaxID=1411316 RepID=UPI00356143BD